MHGGGGQRGWGPLPSQGSRPGPQSFGPAGLEAHGVTSPARTIPFCGLISPHPRPAEKATNHQKLPDLLYIPTIAGSSRCKLGPMPMPEANSETPILDLQVPLTVRERSSPMLWWQGVLLGAGIVVVAIAVGHIAVYFVNETLNPILRSLDPSAAALFLLALGATPFFALALHEVGHFVAGKLVGFDVRAFLGPVVVSQERGKVHLALRKQDAAIGFMCARIITRSVRKLRKKLVFFVAGGPLADLLSVVVITIILGVGTLHGLPAWFKAIAVYWGVVSGIQLGGLFLTRSYHGLVPDGARLRMLARSPENARRWMSILAVDMQRLSGLRPKFWRRTWVQAAGNGKDATYDAFYGCWQAYVWANDCEDENRAGRHLEACLQNVRIAPKSFREALIAEASVFHAWFRHDAEKSQKWFDLLQSPSKLPPLVRIRANVALSWVQNRRDEAFSSWREGLALIKALPAGSREVLEEGWIEWKAQMDARRPIT